MSRPSSRSPALTEQVLGICPSSWIYWLQELCWPQPTQFTTYLFPNFIFPNFLFHFHWKFWQFNLFLLLFDLVYLVLHHFPQQEELKGFLLFSLLKTQCKFPPRTARQVFSMTVCYICQCPVTSHKIVYLKRRESSSLAATQFKTGFSL